MTMDNKLVLFRRFLVVDVKRSIISIKFIVASLGIVVCLLLDSLQDIISNRSGISILYIHTLSWNGSTSLLYIVFASFCSSTLIMSDFESNVIPLWISRGGKPNYATSKCVACSISAMLSVVIAEMVFVIILLPFFPLYMSEDVLRLGLEYSSYKNLIQNDQVLLYLMMNTIIKSSCAAMFSLIAMRISLKIKSYFATIALPLILYYLLTTLRNIIKVPVFLDFYLIARGLVELYDNCFLSFTYSFIFFEVISFFVAIMLIKCICRSVENE